MKKKKLLLIIMPIIIVAFIGLLVLMPVFMMNKNKLADKKDVDKIYNEAINEDLTYSYNDIIKKYQTYLSYPRNMIYLLNLGIHYGTGFAEKFYYAFYDLNNDGIDELIIKENEWDTDYFIDVYYFDGNSAKRIFEGLQPGFWERNFLTILENGRFSVFGSGGAEVYSTTYYGNIKSPKDKVTDWKEFGKIFEYERDYDIEKYTRYDKNQNEEKITEKEYNDLVSSLGNKLDTSKWDWKTITKDSNVIIDEKYKVKDYLYLADKDIFVKGKLADNAYTLQINFESTELKISYPKLFEITQKVHYDVTYCVNDRKKCVINISEYNYPMAYQTKYGFSFIWHYVISKANKVYYDSDNDGYVDETSDYGYFIAPIDEYEKKYGKLYE